MPTRTPSRTRRRSPRSLVARGKAHPMYSPIDRRLRTLARRPGASLGSLSRALKVDRDTVRSHLRNLKIVLPTQRHFRRRVRA